MQREYQVPALHGVSILGKELDDRRVNEQVMSFQVEIKCKREKVREEVNRVMGISEPRYFRGVDF